MAEKEFHVHPETVKLAGFAAGMLEESEAETIRSHLEDCPLCRLEIKRMHRFVRIDTDQELLTEADWPLARIELERSFRERILPGIEKAGAEASKGGGWISHWRWLAPVAAAAAILLIFVNIERSSGPEPAYPVRGLMRGKPEAGKEIILESPAGVLEEAPELFTWCAESEYDSFTLEVFAPDLTRVYKRVQIVDTSLVVPDSLRSLFEPGRIYIWNVKSYRGVDRVVESPDGWFKIHSE